MKNHIKKLFLILTIIAVSLPLTSGCSSPFKKTANLSNATATINFLRPGTTRTMGILDNKVIIEIDKKPRLKLKKRSSVSIDLEPAEYLITLRYKHIYGAKNSIRETTDERWITVGEGENFYLIQAFDEEFRGGFFKIERIDEKTAREIKESF